MTITASAGTDFPAWLPDIARLYLRHVEDGIPLRQLARAEGCHASTVLRRVRRVEEWRDDPLVDEALSGLSAREMARRVSEARKELPKMSATIRPASDLMTTSGSGSGEDAVLREGHRILRRLTEPGALLVLAPGMEKAVVMRAAVRVAVTERQIAQAFALRDWIRILHEGRVTSYEITPAGRAAIRRMIAEETAARGGAPEASDPFAEQHRDWGERQTGGGEGRHRVRANLAESPLGVLARRRDVNGKPFLSADLVAAGERLREDFELAQMGPRVAQNWERFLTGGDRGQYRGETSLGSGSERARERVAAALRDLGPGLGDMVLRCCCFLEGLESAEKRLGWSARSGKIVLRIALMRLKRHYDELYGGAMPMIG